MSNRRVFPARPSVASRGVVIASVFLQTGCIDLDDAPTKCNLEPTLCADVLADATSDSEAPDGRSDALVDTREGGVDSGIAIDVADVDAPEVQDADAPDAKCDCAVGTTETVSGTCTAPFEKMLRTCGSDCTWGAAGCGLPSGWHAINPTSLSARSNATAIWTGTELIVWGGASGMAYLADGARYRPSTDSWTTMAAAPTGFAARSGNAAVWTGSKMVVWGGENGSGLSDGAAYDPALNSWTSLPATTLTSRSPTFAFATTTNEVLLWGSRSLPGTNDGARYRPLTNDWAPFPASPLGVRRRPAFAWTGTQFMAFGGLDSDTSLNDGARYNPVAASWTLLDAPPLGYVSRFDFGFDTVAGGLILVGGITSSLTVVSDGLFIGASGSTELVPPIPSSVLPNPARQTFESWCDGAERCWFWSGANAAGSEQVGGASYDISTRTWSPMTTTEEPSPRLNASVVWTGKSAILWGGRNSSSALADGALFVP